VKNSLRGAPAGLPSTPERRSAGHVLGQCRGRELLATLKNELTYRHVWSTRRHAQLAIFEFIAGLYNQYRRPSTLGYSSPAEVERRTLPATLTA
jgi:transposase InsO family protein